MMQSTILSHLCEYVPSWANWVAQDADGTWWAYEAEPNQYDDGWYENEVGRSLKIKQDVTNKAWQQAIYSTHTCCKN